MTREVKGGTVDVEQRYTAFLVQWFAGGVRNLPLISPYARTLAQRHRANVPGWRALVEAFHTDPFLAAKVTGTANSVFYARDHQTVLTIVEALRRVGGAYAYRLLIEAPPLAPEADEHHIALLWAHCVAVAKTARTVAVACAWAPLAPEVAYLVSLIHDIGYLLQIHYPSGSLLRVANCMAEGETDEDESIHARLGEELARFWFLPSVLTAAIRYHHDPSECTGTDGRHWLACVIALSEQLVDAGVSSRVKDIDMGLVDELQISRHRVSPLQTDGEIAYRRCLAHAAPSASSRQPLTRGAATARQRRQPGSRGLNR